MLSVRLDLFCLRGVFPKINVFFDKMCDLNENPIKLSVKWNGKEYDIPEFSSSDSVAMLKIAIENATGVRPERQKLLNVKFQGKYFFTFSIKIQEYNTFTCFHKKKCIDLLACFT